MALKFSKKPKRISKIPSRQTPEEIFKKISILTSKDKNRPSKRTLKKKEIKSSGKLSKFNILKEKLNVKLDSISRGSIKNKYLKNNFKIKIKKLKDPIFLNTKDQEKEKKICRICFSSECNKKTGDLIKPCNCRGIFSTVHEKCISEWIVSMYSNICDICRFKFFIKAEPKGLIDFIMEEGQFNFVWRLFSIILFSLYLVLIVIAFIILVERMNFLDYVYVTIYKSSCSLMIFVMLFHVGYYFTARYLKFRKWRKYKYHITVKSNPANKFNEIITPPFDPIRSSGLGEYSIKPLIRPVLSN